ncbi:hypothetical protein SKAU_G00316990 [Synaphobranchus kaupii]|uniref:Uncharacterized protein n=1 Tax=Synaphobranchus kaupii TaxID=118154 RepID=A0A9Q1ESS7_SYNKA|nr:hypothetical protein SKAU_G00316990 [Synaphobranchus kaupii]
MKGGADLGAGFGNLSLAPAACVLTSRAQNGFTWGSAASLKRGKQASEDFHWTKTQKGRSNKVLPLEVKTEPKSICLSLQCRARSERKDTLLFPSAIKGFHFLPGTKRSRRSARSILSWGVPAETLPRQSNMPIGLLCDVRTEPQWTVSGSESDRTGNRQARTRGRWLKGVQERRVTNTKARFIPHDNASATDFTDFHRSTIPLSTPPRKEAEVAVTFGSSGRRPEWRTFARPAERSQIGLRKRGKAGRVSADGTELPPPLSRLQAHENGVLPWFH